MKLCLLLLCGLIPLDATFIWQNTTTNSIPENVYTLFRIVFPKPTVSNPTIYVAGDSNVAIFLNGFCFCHKLTRFLDKNITADMLPLPMHFIETNNVLVVRHHNWGNIETFQRTGESQAGLYIESNFGLRTANAHQWIYRVDPQYLIHKDQIIGVTGAHRIRFPSVVNANNRLPEGVYTDPTFKPDSSWKVPVVVSSPKFPDKPPTTETTLGNRTQQGSVFIPHSAVCAGGLTSPPLSTSPYSIADGIKNSKYFVDDSMTNMARGLLERSTPFIVHNKQGDSIHILFDFARPLHGYPILEMGLQQTANVVIDFGYTEKWLDLYSNDIFVNESGYLNPTGIVGKGYADRYTTKSGVQSVELPDERTVRWMTLNVHFVTEGTLHLTEVGIQFWGFPLRPNNYTGKIGYFLSSDETLNQIVTLSLWHNIVAQSDVLVDTTGREDGQWIEDARPRGLIASRWWGDQTLRQVLIRHQAEAQRPDGAMHPFPPSNYPAYPASADWSVQWVAAMYDQYVWSNGSCTHVTPWWKQLVLYWKRILVDVRPDGVWTGQCTNDIRNTPGCPPHSTACSSGMITPWIIERLRWSVKMADGCNESEQGTKWNNILQRIIEGMKVHIIPRNGDVPTHISSVTGYVDGKWVGVGYDQASQTVAMWNNIINSPNERKNILRYTFEYPSPPQPVTRWNNPTYLRRALQALSYNQLGDVALQHLKERFSQYLPGSLQNPTPPVFRGPYGGPLPEYWLSRLDENVPPWEKDTKQPVDATGSHGWCSVALEWVHSWLLGVRVGGLEAAENIPMGTIRIQPDSINNTITHMQGTTFVPAGVVSVVWNLPQLDLSLPEVYTVVSRPVASKNAIKMLSQPKEGKVFSHNDTTYVIRGEGEWKFSC